MEKLKFTTTDGTPIYTNDFINDLRKAEEGKKNSNCFIAQVGPQEDDLHSSVDILVTGGNRGGGKANSYTTPIATPTGFKKMGELQIGDEICTPYEGTQRVSAIYEQGAHTGWKINFDDGTSCVVMDCHRFWARTSPNSPYKEMTVADIRKRYTVSYPYGLNCNVTHDFVEIPLAGRVRLQEQFTPLELPIHPFALGFMCGTGYYKFTRSKGALIKLLGGDAARKLHDCGYTFFKHKDKTYLRGISEDDIDAIGIVVSGTRAVIPHQYLYGSVYTRLEYIRGAIVASGGSHRKCPYLDTNNPKYAEQFAQICRSVGWWARVGEVTDDINKVGYKRVLIKSPDDKDLFIEGNYKKDAHTNANVPYSPNCPNMLTKKIVSITKDKSNQLYRCITVTGNHHLYLSDAYTINHNTFTLLMEALYDIGNKDFHALILRKEKNDLMNIIKDSRRLYNTLGHYNKSKDDMTWYFDQGSDLRLSYFEGGFDDFHDRFQGHQYAYIGVDEFTQIDYAKFKYIITCNRNAVHLHNRFIGTCNPDPLSWVAYFIGWWIGEDGEPIEERNGVIRYCYMKGDDVTQIIWGNTREEVYEQCKEDIDRFWDSEYEKLGMSKLHTSIKSVTFIRAELKYNKKLLQSSPEYLGNLMNQSEEAQARDLQGNWKFMAMGNDLIKMNHLITCFNNPEMTGDGVRRASSDLAFEGGDNCVTWLWIGDHVADVFVCRMDSVGTANAIKSKLEEWGVAETNYTYDLNGLGQSFRGFFKHSRPFNNRESVQNKYRGQFDTVKSQCAWIFADKVIRGQISFDESILERRFNGKGYKNKKLSDILQDERKAIRQDMSKEDNGWCIIKKDQMKKLVGHSPDFIESLFMRYIFNIKATQVQVPDWIKRF